MTAAAHLLRQRSVGELAFTMGKSGPKILRESGASKIRIPYGSTQAITINTGGGLAGGDKFDLSFGCEEGGSLCLTSQAAERVYQTLGPPAEISTHINVEKHAQLFWLPQETILYNGASLARTYTITLATTAKFLAIEPVVFGRTAMGEIINNIHLQDSWRIWRDDKLLHAEELKIGPDLPSSKATLDGAQAMATMIYVADDAETKLDAIRKFCVASAWNGKLIARFTSKDGYTLRKALIPAIKALAGAEALPKIWTA